MDKVNQKTGIELIAEERQRQGDVEGWTPEHDAQHKLCELSFAAAAYAVPPFGNTKDFKRTHLWPFEPCYWKPSNDRIKELVKAGALIAAEIDRLQNITPTT